MKRYTVFTFFILLPFFVSFMIYLFRRDYTRPNLKWHSQMGNTPAYKTGSENPILKLNQTNQPPPEGTISKGCKPFHFGNSAEEAHRAGEILKNPFPVNPENIDKGRRVYENFCLVCHGERGGGDGPLIPKFPNPPSFLTDKSKGLPDGNMLHVITMGRNKMPSYAPQVSSEDRWKAIIYIRHLQGIAK